MRKPSDLLTARASALVAAALLAGTIVLAARPAHATLEIQLQSDGSTYTQSGSSPLVVDHAIGNFTTAVNTGTASSIPTLDLSSADISSAAGGTLVITLSENDLTAPVGLQPWLSQFSGNFSGAHTTVTLQTYLDSSNTLLGTGTALSQFSTSASPFAFSGTRQAGTATPFSITDVLTIVTAGATQLSLDGSVSYDGPSVPEPASIAVFATALLSLGMLAYRRHRA